MRYIILAFALLCAATAVAQNAPRFHNESDSGGYSGADYGATRRYSGADYGATYAPPLWRFTYYPNGIPKAGERKYGFTYWPYSPYRSDYPRDHYDRNRSARYPVR